MSSDDTRRARMGLAVLCALFILLAGVYSYLTPLFEGPDAGAHFRYIAYLYGQRRLPQLDPATAAVSHQLVQQPPLYYALAAAINAGNAVERAAALEQVNPYYAKGMSQRATISAHDAPWAQQRPVWLARAVSLLGGLMTVIATWLLARTLQPQQPLTALAAAAVVALNPQFLFSSATITNDTWTAAFATLAIWLAVAGALQGRAAQTETGLARATGCSDLHWWFGAGVCAGAAALTKYSGALITVPLAAILLVGLSGPPWRKLLWAGLAAAGGFLLLAGVWYGRNLLAWGSPVPLQRILTLLPGLARAEPLAPDELRQAARWLRASYWGVFGYGVIAPAWFHRVTQIFMLGGVVGLALGSAPRLLSRQPGDSLRYWWLPLLLLMVWVGLVFGGLLNWMRHVQATEQGRLLFPAAAAIGLLLVMGWQSWLPTTSRRWLLGAIPILFLGLALSQTQTLYRNYRLPPALAAPVPADRAVQARFAGGMELVGVDFPQGAAIDAGGRLPVTLYLKANRPIDGFYTLFLHLTGAEEQMLFQYDGAPVQGRHPTAQWAPGETFADTYEIELAEETEAGLAMLSMGFYALDEPSDRQAVVNAAGERVTDRVVIGPVRLHETAPSASPASDATPLAYWTDAIALQRADIQVQANGSAVELALVWQARAIIHADYTVFVQVLGPHNQVVAQVDQRPQGGRFPTSTWRAGDVIRDTYRFADLPADWQQIIIGLYNGQGRRLPVHDTTVSPAAPAENTPRDYFILHNRGEQ